LPAKKLKEYLNGRRDKILENPIVEAGIYLDPRFRNISLSGIHQNCAKQTIRALHKGRMNYEENESFCEEIYEQELDNDPLNALITSQFNSQSSSQSSFIEGSIETS
jgi:hypothetical protein